MSQHSLITDDDPAPAPSPEPTDFVEAVLIYITHDDEDGGSAS